MSEFVPIDEIQDARKRKKTRQAFYTPLSLVADMIRTSRVYEGCLALEPSAGDGRIVHALLEAGCKVDACELDKGLAERCAEFGANVLGNDFLKLTPEPKYDLVMMNPPFQKGQAKRHIEHAYKFLKPFGQLVSIAPVTFVEILEQCEAELNGCNSAYHERLSAEVFKESGAKVETIVLWADGPGRREDETCEGFSNWATYNAAITIASDSKWLDAAIEEIGGSKYLLPPEEMAAVYGTGVADVLESRERAMKMARRWVASLGGSCYGVDWREVFSYIIPENDHSQPEITIAPPLAAPSQVGQMQLF